MKPRLISTRYQSLHHVFLLPMLQEVFDFSIVDRVILSNSKDIFYTHYGDPLAKIFSEQGHKVIVDNLQEKVLLQNPYQDCFLLQHTNWFWYQESTWYRSLDYHCYRPNPQWKWHALLPLRIQKLHRDFVLTLIGSDIDKFLWSYQAKGRHLPNDQDPSDWSSQRYFRAEWYDSCAMSLVCETEVQDSSQHCNPFVTEKTWKPVAYFHPFVVAGQKHTLKYLQEQGFATFDNQFDETYDHESHWPTRMRKVVHTTLNHALQSGDKDTTERLMHNHHRFFNQELVKEKMFNDILMPMLEYAET